MFSGASADYNWFVFVVSKDILDGIADINLLFFRLFFLISKNKTLVSGSYVPVFGVKTGVVRILVIFQDRPAFNYINGKLCPRPFK